MGAMTTLFGGGASDAITSKSDAISKSTDASVISPLNPGNFASIRSMPVCASPRYFTTDEADAMKDLAKEKTDGARQSKRAYGAMAKIEEADAKVHKLHRGYEKVVATTELKKKRADAGLANHLHGLRPGYARLGFGIEKAENNATARIESIKAKLLGGAK